MGTAITLGVFVFLLTGVFLGQMVLHNNEAGTFPALVAGIWAAWPFLHQARVQRYNFLHPVPREYKVPVKQAFAKVRELLADISYNFDDKWHVTSADTQSGKITADLRFTDEQIHYDMDQGGVFGMAQGGVSPGGLTVVGEKGPELLNLPSGARVTPNHDLPPPTAPQIHIETHTVEPVQVHQKTVDGRTLIKLASASIGQVQNQGSKRRKF